MKKYWHKDCKFEFKENLALSDERNKKERYCFEHKVFFCKCFWEFGYHYGEKILWKKRQQKNIKNTYNWRSDT